MAPKNTEISDAGGSKHAARKPRGGQCRPWGERLDDFLEMVAARYPEFLLDPRLAVDEGWRKAIKGKDSIVEGTCQACGGTMTGRLVNVVGAQGLAKCKAPTCASRPGPAASSSSSTQPPPPPVAAAESVAVRTRVASYATAQGLEHCQKLLSEDTFDRFDTSFLTLPWWVATVQNAFSKLPLTCRLCRVVCEVDINCLQKRRRVSCGCDRLRVAWSSDAGRVRVMKLIAENQPGFDASAMTPEWWSSNVSGCDSKLMARCRVCDQVNDSTTISHFVTRKKFSCGCRAARQAGVRWKDNREGLLELLSSRQPNLDSSTMTAEWWAQNISGASSRIHCTCRVCKHVCCNTTINNFQKGQGVGCFCNGAVSYASESGRSRILQLLGEAQQYALFDSSHLTSEWWATNVKDAHSCLHLTCRNCEHVCSLTTLNAIQKKRNIGCWCNGGLPWAGPAGRSRMLSCFEKFQRTADISQMTEEWWARNIVDSYSYLWATCAECGYESKKTSVTHFMGRKSLGCICNKALKCSDLAYRIWFLDKMKRAQPSLDVSAMTEEWWVTTISDHRSALRVFCEECSEWSTTTRVTNALQRGFSVQCGCLLKTEKKVWDFLVEVVGGRFAVSRQAGECINPLTGCRLRFDFLVGTTFIELDGPSGHFGFNFYKQAVDENFPRRDLLKERWALTRGMSVIRLLTGDVWRDRNGWKEYILHSLDVCNATGADVRVVTPPHAFEYSTGVYAQLRAAEAAA